MKQRQIVSVAHTLHLAVDLGDRGAGKVARHGETAERHYYRWLYERDLAIQVIPAGCKLGREWVSILGRPALDYVGDEHLRPVQPDLFEQAFEVLPRCPDERASLQIFVAARSLSDKEDPPRQPDPRRAPPASGFRLNHT